MEERILQALHNEAAMVRLLEELEPFVYRLSYHLTQHQQDAEDVAQEALYKICTRLATYKAESAFQSWVYSLVVNTFKDYARKQKRAKVESIEELQVATDTFESSLDSKVLVSQILGGLPERDRQVILLRFLGGLSVKEVASALKISESNVKVKVHRIKQKLQEMFPSEVSSCEM